MQRALAIAALLFFIIGIAGLVFTLNMSDWGTLISIQGNLTFGAFILIGLTVIVNLVMANRNIE